MEFKELQKNILQVLKKYSEKYNVKIDKDFAILKLYEEAGELAQAVIIAKNKSRPEKYISAKHAKDEVGKEMADVLGILIINAHLWNIDLEQAVKDKWTIKLKK